MGRHNLALIKKLKDLGVKNYKDMTFEVSFHEPIQEIKPIDKKKLDAIKNEKIKTVEDDIFEITNKVTIPLLDATV